MSMLPLSVLTVQDLDTDQEVRWCPGCGDYSILSQLKVTLASLDVPRERLVFVSGIGCAGRMTHYLNTYGFHTLHGRAPAVATGIKLARPDLSVWVVTGDGDGLSTGVNHLLHACRRNVDIKILLVNNEVMGLTKGQFSPTSRAGTLTKSSPGGSVETPLRALSVVLAAEATFAARTVDVEVDHLGQTLRRAAEHRGTAFVEVYQNCKVFNDGVFEYATDAGGKPESVLYLEHGRPLLYGRDRKSGLRLTGDEVEVVRLGNGVPLDDVCVHDEQADPVRAFQLSRLSYPDFPECLGVFRAVRRPTHDELVRAQLDLATQSEGPGNLDDLLAGGETWSIP